MRSRNDIFNDFLLACFTLSKRIAETKKNKYQKIPGGYFTVSNCRDLGEILSIPWNKIEDYLKYRIWDYYENNKSQFYRTKRDDDLRKMTMRESEDKVKQKYKNAIEWSVTVAQYPYFKDAEFLKDFPISEAVTSSFFSMGHALEIESDTMTADAGDCFEKLANISKWDIQSDEDLSELYASDIKELIRKLSEGNGSTKITVSGKEVDISETKLFGHWSVIAEVLGINPEELLSPTSDKKALLNYQELTANKNQMEIEELYRNACLEYAKIKFKDEENELLLGKTIGYGEILQIPETDTLLYIDCFWDKLWEDEFSEMLDGNIPEEYMEDVTSNISHSSKSLQTSQRHNSNRQPSNNSRIQISPTEQVRIELKKRRDKLQKFFNDKCYIDSDLAERYQVTGLYIPFLLDKSPQAFEVDKAQKVESRLTSAKTAYAYEMQSDEMFVACYDNTTIIGPAEYGCLLTNRGIYIRNSNENTATFISYADIKEVKPEVKTSNAAESNLAKSAVGFFSKFSKTAGNMFNSAMESFEYEKGFIVINDTIKLEADRMLSPKGGLEKFCKFVEDVKNRKFSEADLENTESTTENQAETNTENKLADASKEETKPYKVNLSKGNESLIKCPSCGAENDKNNKFCDECGASLKIKTPKLCPNCGQEVGEGKKFCGECGTKLI